MLSSQDALMSWELPFKLHYVVKFRLTNSCFGNIINKVIWPERNGIFENRNIRLRKPWKRR